MCTQDVRMLTIISLIFKLGMCNNVWMGNCFQKAHVVFVCVVCVCACMCRYVLYVVRMHVCVCVTRVYAHIVELSSKEF